MTEDWFKRWFNDDYATLYAHRDELEAQQLVDLIQREFPESLKGTVADIACGDGRHLRAVRKLGNFAVGIDLSWALLLRAKQKSTELPIVRGDMRAPPILPGSLSLVLSAFTSFGYFGTDEEHLRLLDAWRTLLSPSGLIVIDYLNSEVARESVGDDRKVFDNRIFYQSRRLSSDGNRLLKSIAVHDANDKPLDHFEESVRLYSARELDSLLEASGLRTRRRFGDYNGNPFTNLSPRLIVAATSNDSAGDDT